MPKNERIYALYKGETNLTDGTIDEIAKYLGVDRKTVHFYKSPTHLRRTSEESGIRLVEIEDEVQNQVIR